MCVCVFQLPRHVLEQIGDQEVASTVVDLDKDSVNPLCDKERFFQHLKVHISLSSQAFSCFLIYERVKSYQFCSCIFIYTIFELIEA